MFRNILVVCTGNICRSPMAEQLLRERTAAKGIKVSSAGTGAMAGWPADELAQEVMREHGHDISAHRAQQITLPMLTGSDLILTLDQTHSDWINSRYPQFRGRVYKLLKWQKNVDVEDPYMRPRKAFERAYADCVRGVDDWLLKLA
ncbi:MAG TPA: low molecular weight protein-tyrosine-phosphatase [Stenotrophobium sp.]|nr:low molecular weight protein-tyrosine-phosphatase [Stenotrophobium sp.]